LTIAPFQRQPRFRALAFDAMQELAREMVEQWLRSVDLEAITLFRAAVARIVDAASDPASCSTTAFGRLVAALHVTAAPIEAEEVVGTLAGRRRFYSTTAVSQGVADQDPLARDSS
jgi:hypothetical protein